MPVELHPGGQQAGAAPLREEDASALREGGSSAQALGSRDKLGGPAPHCVVDRVRDDAGTFWQAVPPVPRQKSYVKRKRAFYASESRAGVSSAMLRAALLFANTVAAWRGLTLQPRDSPEVLHRCTEKCAGKERDLGPLVFCKDIEFQYSACH